MNLVRSSDTRVKDSTIHIDLDIISTIDIDLDIVSRTFDINNINFDIDIDSDRIIDRDREIMENTEKANMEEQRHAQLMNFMTSFRDSIESNIKVTNQKIEYTNRKLDSKFEELNEEMKELSTKVNKNEAQEREAAKRMDDRLDSLEDEMRRYRENQVRRREREQNGKTGEKSKRKEEDTEEKRSEDEEEAAEEVRQTDKEIENLFKRQNKKFERRRIEEKELVKESDAPQGKQVTVVEQTPYRSTWARGIEQELGNMAQAIAAKSRNPKKNASTWQDPKQVVNPENEEQNESWGKPRNKNKENAKKDNKITELVRDGSWNQRQLRIQPRRGRGQHRVDSGTKGKRK